MKKSHAIFSIIAGIMIAGALSFFISADIALFIGFVLTVGLLIYADRKKVKLEGIIFIRRTTKGRDFIDRIANRRPRFWRKLANVGIVLAVALMVLGSLLLISQAAAVIAGAKDGGVKLLLPGPVSDPVNAPGVFVVPWWIWVIGIAVVIIPHEFMHGIMCRIDKVRIKSVGWLLLVLIPGAFVEPDEKQLQKMSKRTKLRVYAAGSFANLIVAGIVLLAAVGAVFAMSASGVIMPAGVTFGTMPGGAAANASLNGTIAGIDGIPIATHPQLTAELQKHRSGDTIEITTAETQFVSGFFPAGVVSGETSAKKVTLAEKDGRPFLGIGVTGESVRLNANFQAYATLSVLLFWIFLFSFGIGLVNLLPIKPLDGGLIFEELVGKRKALVRAVSVFMLVVLLFNIVGPLFLA